MEYLPRIAVYMKHNQPKRETCVASNTTGMANLSKPFDIRQGAIGASSLSVVIITLTKHLIKLFKGRRMYFSSCWQSPNLCVGLYAWRTQLPVDNDKVCLNLETLSICLNYSCKVICVLSCWQLETFPSSLVFLQDILKMLSNAFSCSSAWPITLIVINLLVLMNWSVSTINVTAYNKQKTCNIQKVMLSFNLLRLLIFLIFNSASLKFIYLFYFLSLHISYQLIFSYIS